MSKKKLLARSRKLHASAPAAPVPATGLVATAEELVETKAALEASKKKIASTEKALETMRANREQLLSRHRELQRLLADKALPE